MSECESMQERSNAGQPPARTLQVVTGEIRLLNQQAKQVILGYAIEIGRRLVEAKAMVPHGGWGEYLKNETEYAQSTAQNFIRIFEEYGASQQSLFGPESKSQTLGNLTYTKALELLALPSAEREDFVETHDVEGMSTRELKEAIRARDEAKAAAETAEAEKRAVVEAAEAEKTRAAKLAAELETVRNNQSEIELLVEEERQRTASIETMRADLERELEVLRANPIEVLGAAVPDEAALEAARQEGFAAAKKDAEAAVKSKLEKMKTDKSTADDKLKRLEKEKEAAEIRMQELQERKRVELEAAEQRRTALEKQLAVAGNQDVTSFRVHFEAIQEQYGHLMDCLDRMRSVGDQANHDKLTVALVALAQKMMDKAPTPVGAETAHQENTNEHTEG